MSYIILAYIIGVLCGVGYMYLRYSKRIRKHSREIDQIRIEHAKIVGRFETLCAISGFYPNTDAGDETSD